MILQEQTQSCTRCDAVTTHGREIRMVRWVVGTVQITAGVAVALASAGENGDGLGLFLGVAMAAIGVKAVSVETWRRACVGCMRCRGYVDAEQRRLSPRLDGTTTIDLL